jgi:drug/metabolite transporter (DMT)-like permease
MDHGNLKKGVCLGILSGIVWGWVSILVNYVTGVVTFEESLLHEVVTFSFGGAIFGMVIGGFMSLVGKRLPFKSLLPNAIFVSVAVWLILRIGGVLLSYSNSGRFHSDTAQALQGLVMTIVLGLILATFWNIWKKRDL